MTLKAMCEPRSIAIIGRDRQSNDPASLLTRNLINAGFQGPVLPVDPHRHTVAGVLAYRAVAALPEIPELAIITTPIPESPALISELGARGTRAVLLISNDVQSCQADSALRQTLLAAAKPHRLRLLGPDQLGMAVPANGINATLSRTPLIPGSIGVLAHSATILCAIINWAHLRNIGFSHLVSLGARVDIDCSDLLDHLAQEPKTRAILMYLEDIPNPRQFMSAARLTARLKPVIVLKPRAPGGGSSEESIYDAAFRRAGILRVPTIEQLFAAITFVAGSAAQAVKTLADAKRLQKNRLFILGNSRSIGLLASDALITEGGTPATTRPLTSNWLRSLRLGYPVDNPLDLGDGAGFKEYDTALELLLKEPGVDAILIAHVPGSPELDRESARAIVARAAQSHCPVLISWVGATPSAWAWQLFREAGIATYRTPEEAVAAFLRIAEYHHNQELLMAIPPSIPEEFTPATATAHRIIATALAAGKDQLDIQATGELLAAYQIPMVPTRVATTPADAAALAAELGGSVALKILSAAISNRSDVGGVALALEGPQEVLTAASAMVKRVQTLAPQAVIEGFAIQPMLTRRGAYEVAIGVRTGRDFQVGPVLFFGHGGTEAQAINDIAYALPPLNLHLARDLMARTRLYALLSTSPGRPVDLDALALTLLKVSQMVIDLGELVELDINPLWVKADGVLALSARVRIATATCAAAERLAIHPYPKELEQRLDLPDGGSLHLRPILPEDEPALQAMVRRIPPEDVYRRFFRPLKELSHDLAARLTQLDYDREMAFVLTGPGVPGKADIWALVSLQADSDLETAEYAVVVDRTMGGRGFGSLLMQKIIAYARQRGIREVVGVVFKDNESMLKINRALGFSIDSDPDDPDLVHVSLRLSPEGQNARHERLARHA